MKLIKKITAAALAGMLMLSASACHKKNETAVTVGGVKFTSAYYMCAMIYSDMQARQKVDDAKSGDTSSDSSTSSETDYTKEKIDGVDYSKYVKDETLKSLKKIAAYKLLCEKNKLETDKDTADQIKQSAESMWSYGYSTMFENNGVYKATFLKYTADSNYAETYFDHVYGKDGTNPVSAEEVSAKMLEKFVLLQYINASFTTTDSSTGSSTKLSDDEITSLKTKINGYADEINSGKKTFEQVYHEYNNTEESSDNQSSSDETPGDAAEKLKPVYNHASVYGDSDTVYKNDNYGTVKEMTAGQAKVIELADNGGLLLVVKRDLASDPYYVDQLDSPTRHLLKDADMDKELEAFLKDVKINVSSYATDRFKVKKIKYPSAS